MEEYQGKLVISGEGTEGMVNHELFLKTSVLRSHFKTHVTSPFDSMAKASHMVAPDLSESGRFYSISWRGISSPVHSRISVAGEVQTSIREISKYFE